MYIHADAVRTIPAQTTINPRFHPLVVVLAVGTAVFSVAGALVAILTLEGHDFQMGFRRLLDLNTERNLPTWFSSAILLSAAALLGATGLCAEKRQRRAWFFLGAVFVLLSLDEMASLHEMSNAPLRSLLRAGPALYFPWILIGLTFGGIVFLTEWRLLLSLPRRTSAAFVVSGIVYVAGAVGFEALAAPLYARHLHPRIQAALMVTEETLEMVGVVMFILAIVRYAIGQRLELALLFERNARQAQPAHLRVTATGVARAMMYAVLALVAINLALQSVHYFGGANISQTVRLFDLSREGNVPTWYQSYTLLACGGLTGLIAATEWQRRGPQRVWWTATALAFVYLSADEAGSIHEMLVGPLRHAFHTTGLLYYPWVAVGLVVVIVGAIAARPFIVSLPPRTRRMLVAAAIVYISGALGVEAVSGKYAEQHGRRDMGYVMLTTVEETLEMLGVVIVARGLLEHLRDHVGPVRLAPTAAK